MYLFIFTLIVSGIVGILSLVLGWSITVSLIASGVAAVSYIIFYIIIFTSSRYSNKGNLAIMMLEIVMAAVATIITMFVCKYDLYHTLALIAPCLMGARILGGRIVGAMNKARRG